MKHGLIMLLVFLFACTTTFSQNSVDIDGRLQPILNDFLDDCASYGIETNEKLFQLKKIDISKELPLEENNTVLGVVTRDANNNVENILINWAAMIDPEILKIVAYHEFAHHFLDYKHTCQDCNEIMAVTNSNYFLIAKDWEKQVENLFLTSPAYLAKDSKEGLAASSF